MKSAKSQATSVVNCIANNGSSKISAAKLQRAILQNFLSLQPAFVVKLINAALIKN
jgi:hypothetical protein